MGIRVELKDENLRRFEELLKGLSGAQARRVMADAMNKSSAKTVTTIRRELSFATGMRYRDVSSNMKTRRATPASLDFVIEQSGQETNLNLYRARQGAYGVIARPWNISRTFAGSFIIPKYGNKVYRRVAGTSPGGWQKRRWNFGFAEKKASSRFPIEQLWGPNLAREIVREDGKPVQAFDAGLSDLQKQVESQLMRRAIYGFGF